MLEEHLALAEKFHLKVTGLPMPDAPALLVGDRRDYVTTVINEEHAEFLDATTIADQADALIDLIYFLYGRVLEMGIKPGPAFQLVHDANMKKVRGANKRGNTFEAQKPDGWTPPDWDAFLGTRGKYVGLKPRKKVLILGHGRHGKDTVAEMLAGGHGYKFTSSSMFCADKVMMPYFEAGWQEWYAGQIGRMSRATMPVRYETAEACFADRHNHRATWFKEIERYNAPDAATLARAIFAENDIYVGIRSKREFAAAKIAGCFDVAVWVDASDRLPPEDRSSCTVEPWMADYVIDNNGSVDQLKFNVRQFAEHVL